MGHVPKGTVERRRSIQHGVPANASTARAEGAGWESEDVVNRGSARLIWEAGWLWIESHIEEYVEKFSDFGSRSGEGKYEIWERLVRMRLEWRDLDRQLSCVAEDVRG